VIPGHKAGQIWTAGDSGESLAASVELLPQSVFRQEAARMKLTYGWGRERIHRELFEAHSDHGFAVSDKTIERWLKNVPKGPVSSEVKYVPAESEPSVRPDLAKLDLVKKALTAGGNLSRREADVYGEIRHFFKSSNELIELDYFPLFAIVESYAMRELLDIPTADLDTMLAYQPWNPENTGLYMLAVQQGAVSMPVIHRLMEFADDGVLDPHTAIVAAYAQLRLPCLTMFYRSDRSAGYFPVKLFDEIPSSDEWTGTSFDERASLHSWRDHIGASITGETVKLKNGMNVF